MPSGCLCDNVPSLIFVESKSTFDIRKRTNKMGSISNEIRVKQKEKAEAVVKAREDALTEAGVTGKAQGRDPVLRRAKAEVKRANRRLNAIVARDAHVKKIAEEKGKEKAKKEAKKKGKSGSSGKAKKGDGKAKKAKKKK